jgi:hypothetical protein
MTEPSIRPFARAHLDGLIALAAAEGWDEYTADVERTRRALIAPGVTTLVTSSAGESSAQSSSSDGLIQAHVSMLLIDRTWRGHRLAPGCCARVWSARAACGSTSAPGPGGYYERLGASRSLGFRLTREDLGRGGTADN